VSLHGVPRANASDGSIQIRKGRKYAEYICVWKRSKL